VPAGAAPVHGPFIRRRFGTGMRDKIREPISTRHEQEADMGCIQELAQLLGPQHVLTGADAAPYMQDWRGRYSGSARAVARPGSVQELAEVVKWCAANQLPIVPQGGNSSLCGGATPD